MTEKSDTEIYAMSDLAIQKMIGDYIKETRLAQNKTQVQVAEEAGIARSTLVQIENGNGGTLSTLIQLLRTLGQLYLIKTMRVQKQISPLELAKLEQSKRIRARSKTKNDQQDKSDW